MNDPEKEKLLKWLKRKVIKCWGGNKLILAEDWRTLQKMLGKNERS